MSYILLEIWISELKRAACMISTSCKDILTFVNKSKPWYRDEINIFYDILLSEYNENKSLLTYFHRFKNKIIYINILLFYFYLHISVVD